MTTLDLPVGGMECAACARTVERSLAALEGVEGAHVNFATNTATVEYDAARTGIGEFVQAIEDAGYSVPKEPEPDREAAYRTLRRRLWIAAAFTLPVLVLAMSHGAIHLPGMAWIQLALTLPVVGYAGEPFLRGRVVGAATSLRPT